MKKWTFLPAFVCSLAGFGCPLTTQASSPGAPSSPPGPYAATLAIVEKALIQADVPALARMYQAPNDPVSRVLAAMVLERIHFNLEKSSEDARVCERNLIDSKPEVAFFCAKFANGNLRLSQGSAKADAAELDIIHRFEGKVAPARLEQMRSYLASQAGTPQLELVMPSHSFSIPVHRSLAQANLPAVEVESGGKKTWLLVDTGSSALTLDEDSARKLGVAMVDRTGKVGGFLSHDIPVRYGTLARLGIGELTLLNVPVTVVPADHRLLGMDILRRLGAFRLTESSLVVGDSSDGDGACREPMLVSSDVWGNQLRVVTALSIDGQLRTALIDSGTSHYLAADQHALDELHSSPGRRLRVRDMGAHQHAARVSRATADIDISGQPFTVTFDVFKQASLPRHYLLGGGALRYMDFLFDFNNRHTCLLIHPDRH
jgi:predicted aspartyl protease